jgi:hypothetical protein
MLNHSRVENASIKTKHECFQKDRTTRGSAGSGLYKVDSAIAIKSKPPQWGVTRLHYAKKYGDGDVTN